MKLIEVAGIIFNPDAIDVVASVGGAAPNNCKVFFRCGQQLQIGLSPKAFLHAVNDHK
jgi:hypothetical protein